MPQRFIVKCRRCKGLYLHLKEAGYENQLTDNETVLRCSKCDVLGIHVGNFEERPVSEREEL